MTPLERDQRCAWASVKKEKDNMKVSTGHRRVLLRITELFFVLHSNNPVNIFSVRVCMCVLDCVLVCVHACLLGCECVFVCHISVCPFHSTVVLSTSE